MLDDPTTPRTGHQLAGALVSGELAVPGHRLTGREVEVRLVGQGESYAAWLVEAPGEQLLFRFPRRPPEQMPATVAAEFAALRQVPAGLGTRGVAVDDTTDNPLGRRYLVTTFVPGVVRDGSAWDRELLEAHTRLLARLHEDTRHDGPLQAATTPRDLVRELDDCVAGWSAEVPGVAAQSSAGGLVARVHGGPWYVPLTGQQVEEVTLLHLRSRGDLDDSPAALQRLLARREAWEVFERFTSSLHFEKVFRTSPAGARYGPWVRLLRSTLDAVLP